MLEENGNLNHNSQPTAADNNSNDNAASNPTSQVDSQENQNEEFLPLDTGSLWPVANCLDNQSQIANVGLRGEPADLSDDEQ